MIRFCLRIWLFCLLLFLAPKEATATGDIYSARSMGMGGTLRASSTGATAILLNPAGMSLARMYSLGATYQHRFSDTGSLFQISIVDSATRSLAAGIAYSLVHATPEMTIPTEKGIYALKEKVNEHKIGLCLSYPLGDYVFLGVGGHYVSHSIEIPQDAPSSLESIEISAMALDVGLIIKPVDGLYLGFVGYNLISIHDQIYPQSLGLAIAYQAGDMFVAGFDAVLDFTSQPDNMNVDLHGGIEFFLAKQYAVRLGIMHKMFGNKIYASGGFGMILSQIALEAGVRQEIEGGTESQIVFSAQLFLQ